MGRHGLLAAPVEDNPSVSIRRGALPGRKVLEQLARLNVGVAESGHITEYLAVIELSTLKYQRPAKSADAPSNNAGHLFGGRKATISIY